MGAKKKSMTKKCGEILINIKTNKKTKVYIFHCAFCDTKCDQLKKFSLHLDERHSQELEFGVQTSLVDDFQEDETTNFEDIKEEEFVTGIKTEDFMGMEELAAATKKKQIRSTNGAGLLKYSDPLEANVQTTVTSNEMEIDVKMEDDFYDSDADYTNLNGVGFICEYSGSESEDNDDKKKPQGRETNLRKCKPKKEVASDASSDDDSRNSDFDSMESENNKTNIFVRDFVNSEQNVTSIIEAYKNQPNLWNRNYPQHRLKERHTKYLEKIREELKDKINVQISSNQVAAVIQYLCRKYRQDLKILKLNEGHWETLDNKNQPVWYFKNLDFLKPYVEKNLSAAIKIKQLDLMPEQIIRILEIYQRFPHLWNTNLLEHVCRNKHLEAMRQMQATVDAELGLQLTEVALKNNIHFLQKHFSKIKRCNLSNNNATHLRSKYYEHMQFLYDHVGPFRCPECGQVFKNPLTFKEHKSQHDGSYAFKCSSCNKEYSKASAYIVHARRHMEDLSEECKECGKRFITISDLKIHMRSHTGAQPYCCEICGVSFRHRGTLTEHRRRHQNEYRHTCPICSKGFYKKDKMNDHIRSHSQIREFVCKTCGKAFIRKKTLKQHEVVHEDVRKHACTLCGKAFKRKVGLIQHMRAHGGQI